MSNNITWLAIDGAGSFLVAMLFLIFRWKRYRNFGDYWDSEGLPVWLISFFVLGAFLMNHFTSTNY